MAIDTQILTCPLCHTEHSAADAEFVPGVNFNNFGTDIPDRYRITCGECDTDFYRKVENK